MVRDNSRHQAKAAGKNLDLHLAMLETVLQRLQWSDQDFGTAIRQLKMSKNRVTFLSLYQSHGWISFKSKKKVKIHWAVALNYTSYEEFSTPVQCNIFSNLQFQRNIFEISFSRFFLPASRDLFTELSVANSVLFIK